VPRVLGMVEFTADEVCGIAAIQVLFATIDGVSAYRDGGCLNNYIIAYMGVSVVVGSVLGGDSSSVLPVAVIDVVYGVLALLAVFVMFMTKQNVEETTFNQQIFKRGLGSLLAWFAGVGAGIVGAGGSFLLVPLMLVILKIPTRMTIASSLAITFISSIGTSASKVVTGQVTWLPSIIMVVASLIASPLGAKTGKNINTTYLQWILAILILGTAVKVWMDILV